MSTMSTMSTMSSMPLISSINPWIPHQSSLLCCRQKIWELVGKGNFPLQSQLLRCAGSDVTAHAHERPVWDKVSVRGTRPGLEERMQGNDQHWLVWKQQPIKTKNCALCHCVKNCNCRALICQNFGLVSVRKAKTIVGLTDGCKPPFPPALQMRTSTTCTLRTINFLWCRRPLKAALANVGSDRPLHLLLSHLWSVSPTVGSKMVVLKRDGR